MGEKSNPQHASNPGEQFQGFGGPKNEGRNMDGEHPHDEEDRQDTARKRHLRIDRTPNNHHDVPLFDRIQRGKASGWDR